MSVITSKFDDIDKLWLEPLSAKVVNVTKITMVDHTIIALGVDGKVYTNGVIGHCCYSGANPRLWKVLDGLIKLRVVSAEVVRQHKAYKEQVAAAMDKRHAAKYIKEQLGVLGLKLTPAQSKVVEQYEDKPGV